jgi:deoxyribose-phosphate aldolase
MDSAARATLVERITDRVLLRLTQADCTGRAPTTTSCGCNLTSPTDAHLRAMVDEGACRLSCDLKARSLPPDLAGTIDHTLLKPQARESEIRTLCGEARANHFASVCVNPYWVQLCASLLSGAGVEVCSVIGFPLGATTSTAKAFEAGEAVRHGATEVDMVVNVGALKDKNYAAVHDDIRSVVQSVEGGACVKVILETALLEDEEKVAACALAKEAGAHYVKTSTGFGGGGATVADVALMRGVVGAEIGVKASGGIRDRKTAEAMIKAGANRLGASAGVKILAGESGGAGY